jgi:hypothetical protein
MHFLLYICGVNNYYYTKMKKGLLLLTWLCAALTGQAQQELPAGVGDIQAEENEAGKNVLTGFVLNQDGKPVAGAQICVTPYQLDSKETPSYGVTDEYGHYMIPIVGAPNDFNAIITTEGYPEYVFSEHRFDFSNYSQGSLEYRYNKARGAQTQTFYICDAAVFHAGQLATIFLPTEPDASLGQFYRLDRIEDNHLVVEREMNPKADVPYLIIPDRDFRIEYAGNMKDTDKWVVQRLHGAAFYAFYTPHLYSRLEKETTLLIDKTPDCNYWDWGNRAPINNNSGARVGAMRGLITLEAEGGWNWTEDFDRLPSAADNNWMGILLFHDGTTGTTFTYKSVEAPSDVLTHSSFAGIVVDQGNKPVANARVRLRNTDGSTASETETDGFGHFLMQIEDVNKPYAVSIVAEGSPEQWQYRDGWQMFDFSRKPQAEKFFLSRKVVFKAGQRATIVLPTKPEPTLGTYYKLGKVEDDKIVFYNEPNPEANIPYVIIPSNDFEIDYSDMAAAEQTAETTVSGVSLKGFYSKHAYKRAENEYAVLLDKTLDCSYIFEGEHSYIDIGCTVGAMRAVLVIDESEFKGLEKDVEHEKSLYDRWIIDKSVEFRNGDSGIDVNAVEMLSDSPAWSYAVVSLKTSQSTDCYVFQVRDDMRSPYSMNGKTYHALYRVVEQYFYKEHQPYLVFSDPIGIRESEGRIYVNYDDFKRELDFQKEYLFLEGDIPYEVTPEGEILLYDFSLQKGDEYPTAAGSNMVYVDKVEEIVTEDGLTRKLFTLSNGLQIVEGIGCINSAGSLLYYLYSFGLLFNIGEDNKILLNRYSKGGKQIYTPDNLSTAGIDNGPTLENAITSFPLFDLQGRRITSKPTKGVYINGGKKWVAK